MNMNAMMKQLQQVQKKVMSAQQELESARVEGEAGGGKVRVTLSGKGDLLDVKLDKSVVDPEDPGLLEDLLLTAFKQARDEINRRSEEIMGAVKMPGMPGMPGFR